MVNTGSVRIFNEDSISVQRKCRGDTVLRKVSFAALLLSTLFWCDVSNANPKGSSGDLKFVSGCETDLDNDGKKDIVMLVGTSYGRELIALMRAGNGYQAYVVAKDVNNMILTCRQGKTITPSEALDEETKEYATPGAYIELKQPEGAAVAYFWNGTGFTEVWTSD